MLVELKLKMQYPILQICAEATGINCTNGDFANCKFFQNLLDEFCKKHKCPCKYNKHCQQERMKNAKH